jgi:uncharacterized protein YdaU (DUF1376 family)
VAKNDEWFPFYPRAYLGDTMHLTPEQDGCYMRLLMHQWLSGPLKNDDVFLSRLSRISLGKFRRNVKAAVLPYFDVTPEGLSQKRLAAERAKANDISTKRAAAGRARAANAGVLLEQNGQQNGTPVPVPVQREEREALRDISSPPLPPSTAVAVVPGPTAWMLQIEGVVADRETGRPCVSGTYLDIAARRVFDAARIDETKFRGDLRPLVGWLAAGIELPDIVRIVKHIASHSDYTPPWSLGRFTRSIMGEDPGRKYGP